MQLGKRDSIAAAKTAVAPGFLSALPLVAACASFVMSMVMQWRGVVLPPDGWAYWEASVSLLRGEGYRYFGGQPLGAWPPAFPLYLAGWQHFLGVSAGTVALAHAVAGAAASGLWVACALRLRIANRDALQTVILAIPMALTLPIALRIILSESLFLAFLGAAVWLALWRPSGRLQGVRGVLFTAALLLLLLTRNVGVAFVPALGWLFLRCSGARGRAAWIAALAGIAAGIGGWLVCRAALGQLGSHRPIPLSSAADRALDGDLLANLRSGWGFLFPASLSGAALALLAIGSVTLLLRRVGGEVRPEREAERPAGADGSAVLASTALAVVGTVVVLTAYGFADRRFVLPLVPLGLLATFWISTRTARSWARQLATAALIVIAATQLARGAYWVRSASVPSISGVPFASKIVTTCVQGPPGCIVGPLEVDPPDFEWIDRDYSRRHRTRPQEN